MSSVLIICPSSLIEQFHCKATMCSCPTRSECRCQQNGLGNLLFARPSFLCTLDVALDAVNTLCGMGHGQRDQFAVFSWNTSIFSCDNTIQVGPRLELLGRQLGHLFQKFEIVFIVVMVWHKS